MQQISRDNYFGGNINPRQSALKIDHELNVAISGNNIEAITSCIFIADKQLKGHARLEFAILSIFLSFLGNQTNGKEINKFTKQKHT